MLEDLNLAESSFSQGSTRERERMKDLSMFQVIFLVWLSQTLAIAESVTLHGCPTTCGGVIIPYPFGIGSGCYLNKNFEVTCNRSSESEKPFLTSIKMELLGVSMTGQVQVRNPIIFSESCSETNSASAGHVDLSGSPFMFSSTYNRFTGVGCNNYATIHQNDTVIGGCLSLCDGKKRDGCYGLNCCQTTIPPNVTSFEAQLGGVSNTTVVGETCKFAFMVDQSWFTSNQEIVDVVPRMQYVPAVLQWGRAQGYCDIRSLTPDTFCSGDGYCWKEVSKNHLCVCRSQSFMQSSDYVDYIQTKCSASKCLDLKRSTCRLFCINTPGSSECICPDGYFKYSDSDFCFFFYDYTTLYKKSRIKIILIGCGSGLGLLLLLICCWWLYRIIKKRKAIKLKHKCFERNGGLLLQQQLSSGENNVEHTKLFTSEELEKATDNYHASRILGQGGQGTVYKGMLTDGRIVAVKKSKAVDEDRLEQFINEVVILSQINHRNVVKLLGCCLETQVPLLVYEFIPNGTLHQHIHDPSEEFPITWEMRLRIAAESAGAISYLHSAASMPIYHRDIKSTNILLDDKYRAKVSDFGTSKSIAVDQTHVTTKVQGTFGYLDPEYFQSSQFTEKSDVYSFGVVLAELLTGQKPISSIRAAEGRSLATYFLMLMEENRLFEIVDGRVLKEAKQEEIMAVGKLAKRCLNLNGKKRPTMKTVAIELEGIRSSHSQEGDAGVDASSIIEEKVDYYTVNDMTCPWDAASSSTNVSAPLDVHVQLQPLLSNSWTK